MSGLPRALCPVCRRTVPLRTNGEIREHRFNPRKAKLCKASGKTVPVATTFQKPGFFRTTDGRAEDGRP